VRNEKVLYGVSEDVNIIHKIKGRNAESIGHNLLSSRLLKHVIEGRIEVKGRRGRRHKQLLHDLKERIRYCKLKEEALDRSVWRTRFVTDVGAVVMNECTPTLLK
jgi:hypothetical protein